MTNIIEISKISLENRRKKREERIFSIIGYLKLNPGQTVYSLQKYFGWPIGSIHSILTEQEEDMHLKSVWILEKNREKKLYSLRLEDDFIVDYFNALTLLVPINLRTAKNAQSKGYAIEVEMSDGSVVEVPPEYLIEDFIRDRGIELELGK